MIASIVLTGMYNIGISTNNTIKTPDGVVVNLSDIPFVRYRFEKYGDEELEFIKNNKAKFPCVHVVEVTANENALDTLQQLEDMDDTIAKFLYIDITDEELHNGLSDEVEDILGDIYDEGLIIDGLNLRDKSTETLIPIISNQIKKAVKDITGVKEKDIGVCGGPYCFYDGQACLTAVKARSLLATYSDRDDVVVPSSNHEGKLDNTDELSNCTNKCGCIRYYTYNSDMDAPEAKKAKTKKVEVENKETKKKVEVLVGDKDESKAKESKPKTKKVKTKGFKRLVW